MPDDLDGEFERSMQVQALIDEWEQTEAAVTYINDKGSFSLNEPMRLPKDVAEKRITTSMNLDGTLADLAGVLRPLGLFLAIPDASLRDQPIIIFHFEGSVGDFLDALSAAYGVSFNWNSGNVITVEETSMYTVNIPQDGEVAKSLAANIAALGAQDVDASVEAGAISYKADLRTHQRVINFLDHVAQNSALVSMQVAIINVNMERGKETGIDWSRLNFHLGRAGALQNAERMGAEASSRIQGANNMGGGQGFNQNTQGGSGVGSDDLPGDDLSSLMLRGSSLSSLGSNSQVGGQSSQIGVGNKDFAIGTVIDYLSTYGKTETTQSLLLKTLSGKEVRMKSAQEIPFIDSVGVSNLGGGGQNNNQGSQGNQNTNQGGNQNQGGGNNSGLGLGTVNIETIDVGLNLSLIPFFQSRSELVTITVDLELSSLLSFMDLNAGNQIGSVTRPNLQEQAFNDIIKMRAGDTAVIGGITYDQKSDRRNTPSFFERFNAAHKDASFNRNAMIIMIRPTVTVFTELDSDVEVKRR